LDGAPDQIIALQRVRWLDELSDAISQAQTLALSIGTAGCEEARQLHARLETVRNDVQTLRTCSWTAVRKEIDPKWLERLFHGCSGAMPQACTE